MQELREERESLMNYWKADQQKLAKLVLYNTYSTIYSTCCTSRARWGGANLIVCGGRSALTMTRWTFTVYGSWTSGTDVFYYVI